MEKRKVVFDDGGKPSVKSGSFEKEDELFLYLRRDDGVVEVIAKTRIIRQEITGA